MEADDALRKTGLLTLPDVAKYLGVHRSTIYRMLKKNKLPAFRFDGEWRFNRASIDRWRAEAVQDVSRANNALPFTQNADTQATQSQGVSPLPADPAKHQESSPKAGAVPWSGWPRLTDP